MTHPSESPQATWRKGRRRATTSNGSAGTSTMPRNRSLAKTWHPPNAASDSVAARQSADQTLNRDPRRGTLALTPPTRACGQAPTTRMPPARTSAFATPFRPRRIRHHRPLRGSLRLARLGRHRGADRRPSRTSARRSLSTGQAANGPSCSGTSSTSPRPGAPRAQRRLRRVHPSDGGCPGGPRRPTSSLVTGASARYSSAVCAFRQGSNWTITSAPRAVLLLGEVAGGGSGHRRWNPLARGRADPQASWPIAVERSGRLTVRGTDDDPVIFTTDADDRVSGDTNTEGDVTDVGQPGAQALDVVRIEDGNRSSSMSGAAFNHAQEDIHPCV